MGVTADPAPSVSLLPLRLPWSRCQCQLIPNLIMVKGYYNKRSTHSNFGNVRGPFETKGLTMFASASNISGYWPVRNMARFALTYDLNISIASDSILEYP